MNAVSIEKEMRHGSRACDALAGTAEGITTLMGELERGYMDPMGSQMQRCAEF